MAKNLWHALDDLFKRARSAKTTFRTPKPINGIKYRFKGNEAILSDDPSEVAREAVLSEVEGTIEATCRCQQGVIKLRIDLDIPGADKVFEKFPIIPDYAALSRITREVKIEVKPLDPSRRKLSITLPAAEAVELIGGQAPCTETFESIYRQVCGLKQYPLPEPEIPGGGGKSLTAQGQTKKPGSHSHDRHK